MKKTTSPTHEPLRERHDRLLKEREHDTYKARLKPEGPVVCGSCGVVFAEGRWQWHPAADNAARVTCPACQRIQDKVPAGFLSLHGDFIDQHRDEIMSLIRNVEQKERGEHPLNRIMAIEPQDEGVLITFTDTHLARGVGEALHAAYKGDLAFAYTDEEHLVRGSWKR